MEFLFLFLFLHAGVFDCCNRTINLCHLPKKTSETLPPFLVTSLRGRPSYIWCQKKLGPQLGAVSKMRPRLKPAKDGEARPQPEKQVSTNSKPVDGGEASASTNPAEGAVAELTTLKTRLQEQEQQRKRSEKVVQSLDQQWKTRNLHLHLHQLRGQMGGCVPVCPARHQGPCSSLGRQPSSVEEGGNVTVRLPVTAAVIHSGAQINTEDSPGYMHRIYFHTNNKPS